VKKRLLLHGQKNIKKKARKIFEPYKSLEDEYSRLAPLYLIFAWVVAPIFTILTYTSELSRPYIFASFSFTVGLTVYVLLARIIVALRDKLMYLFLFHLFATSCYLFVALLLGGFQTIDIFSFLTIYALFSLAIQRFYPLLIYNVLIISLIVYALVFYQSAEISNKIILAFFLLIAMSSTYMIYSRQLLLNNVEDYSRYLKDILDNPETGYVLLEFNDHLSLIDMNDQLQKALFNNVSWDEVEQKIHSWFSKSELDNLKQLRLGHKEHKRIETSVYERTSVYDIQITRLPLKNGDGILMRFNDVTTLIQKKRESEINEKRYRNLFLRNHAGVFVMDINSTIIDANPAFLAMFSNSIKLQDKLFKDLQEWTFLKEIISTVGELKNYQTVISLEKGDQRTVVFNLFQEEGALNIKGSVVDLTTYEEATNALKQSEEKYRLIYESSNDAILLLDGQKVMNANKKAQELFPRIIGGRLFNYSEDRSIESEKKFVKKRSNLSDQKSVKFDWIFKGKGGILETEVFISEVVLEGVVYHQCVVHDQTEVNSLVRETARAQVAEETNRKLEQEIFQKEKAENKLNEQLLRSKAIFESSSNTFLLTLDLNGYVLTFNSQSKNYYQKISGIQLEAGLDFKESLFNFLNKNEIRTFQYLTSKVYKGKQKQVEFRLNINDREYWLEVYLSPIYGVNNEISEISLVAHDITEKQQASEEIRESLKEKEILLKEIHHRVKNNMQVISSILNLQSSYVEDKNTLLILQESRDRIRSMAMIHESLYKRDDFSSIDFSGYIDNLVQNLVSSYQVGQKIKINKDLQRVSIDLDQAIPCGLLVNEVITNSLKYGWDEEGTGNINIALKKEDNTITIEIGDDGRGLPEEFDLIKSDTLGLQLIITLVEQLDGQLSVDISKGTKYLIKFDGIKPNSHV
jgi:PAS domain S-box-containing protein